MFIQHVRYIRYHGEASENLQNALDVEYGTNSTYEHAHMPKINSSPVKILPSSRNVLAEFAELGLQILSQLLEAS